VAKTSKLVKNRKRLRTAERLAERRAELVAVIKNPTADPETKDAAYHRLYKMPRDGSRTRYVNRCEVTGRPRAYIRKFGMSRIAFRELANEGMLPGVKKASW